jgi:hypothetical protein
MSCFQSIFNQFNLLRWMQTQLDGIEIHNGELPTLNRYAM